MSSNLLDQYKVFVRGVTSPTSMYSSDLINRIQELAEDNAKPATLLTSAIGLADESGEFAGMVKKIIFHGKPFSEENKEYLKKELGDVMWYWMQGCIALDIDPEDVILENIRKLESRYPGGSFSMERAETRAAEDK